MVNLLEEARNFVTEIFVKEVSPAYVYHNIEHTLQVESAVVTIAEGSGLSGDDVLVLRLAALFHDIGYRHGHSNHEEAGMLLAEEFLTDTIITAPQMATIQNCIRSTNIEVLPENLMEEIICDADLSYLGYKAYFNRGEVLRTEWENTLNLKYSDAQWYTVNLNFFRKHQYYTSFAKQLFDAQKQKNIELIEELLKRSTK